MRTFETLLPLATALTIIGALALSLSAASGEPTLTLTLRADGMAFYLDGESAANPPLVLPPDRRVRITFVNEDQGVAHDLVLAELDVRTDILPGDGSSQVLEFRTPRRKSDSSYSCSMHLIMMTGALEIR